MIESWRWFGPLDQILLPEIAQTGASGIVTALHEIPYGEIWETDAIRARQALIAVPELGLEWQVVESLPVHEDIKRGESNITELFDNYRQSLRNLATCGIYTVCYNFMPLLDWTRTDLRAPLANMGTALRFSKVHMAAFELFMLQREGAEQDYSPPVQQAAKDWFGQAKSADCEKLMKSIMSGLPGAFERYDLEGLRSALGKYRDIDRTALRGNFARFLAEIIPTADELGIRMCVHPDDPPHDLLGLPRIVSTQDDLSWVFAQQNSLANGLTLCSGSLGANPNNDVVEIAKEFSDRIHFSHLRNTTLEPDGSFQEAAHLEGDTNMVSVIAVLLAEEKRRRDDGRFDFEIPFRPDHGHDLLGDVDRQTHPGYPLIGRVRGLAELRGVIAALSNQEVKNA